ncbi:unnamed protein product [Scytosiphon promiscuus]
MNIESRKTQRARKKVRFADQQQSTFFQQASIILGHGLRDESKQGRIIDESGSFFRASNSELGEDLSMDDSTGGVGITAEEAPLTAAFRKETAVLQPHRRSSSFRQSAQLTGTDLGIRQNRSSLPTDNNEGTTSLEIVPYTGQGSHRLLHLTPDKQNNGFSVLHNLAWPHFVSQDVRDMSGSVRRGESGISAGSLRPQYGGPMLVARSNVRGVEERRSNWMIVSAEQVEHTAEKLRHQAEKNKVLESAIEDHKRERILIYDAAMKQAAKREEEGINDAKLVLELEQSKMRSAVDQELRKIGDLYQERCRDYASMVSDECEASISKAASDLRKDWARQRKTIDELVQCGGEEDRQVSVIARAVMDQLREEKMDDINALRADIYSDVKVEFESREAALRDALQHDYQADLDGQLLMAEIRHQKEIDRLRLELRGEKGFVQDPTTRTVTSSDAKSQCEEGGENTLGGPSSSQTPLASRRLVQKKMNAGAASALSDSKWVAVPSAKPPGLGRKLPAFKTPIQKISGDLGNLMAVRPADRSTSQPIPQCRTLPGGSRSMKRTERSTPQNDGKTTTPGRKGEDEHDGGVTGALVVSPTKAIPGVVTPSMETGGRRSGEESSRPKKRTKRLILTACS